MEGRPAKPPPMKPYTPRDKVALILEILSAYATMLRVLGQKDVLGMVARARAVETASRVAEPLEHEEAKRLGKVVGRTLGVLPTDSRCLIRSLVLVRVLARRAIPSTLVIGVRRSSKFQAHAWVEHEGQAILPAGDYTRLTEL